MPSQSPAPVEPTEAFPTPATGSTNNPFAQSTPPSGASNASFESSPKGNVPPSLGPSLFPSAPAQSSSGTGGVKERRPTSRKRKRTGDEAARSRGKSKSLVIGLGAVAVLSAGAFFLVPGLKDKILGNSETLPVTADSALPVPPKPDGGTVPPNPVAAAGASGIGEQPAGPAINPPSALPPDPEAASKPAPDFGLGDPAFAPDATSASLPAETLLPTPVSPETDTQAPPAPSNEEAQTSGESFEGDATASPEDVAAARTILENFINAQTIEERLSYSQPAPKIEEQMRDYYSKHPTPARIAQINYTLANVLEGSTKRFFIFEVTTDQQQQGFPVAVEETEGGMKVDWRSFVEFHDNMLGRFISVYRPGTESFRVILERAHYFKTDVPDLGSKLAFRIKPPIPGFEGFAFCSKDNTIGEELDRKFAWDVKYLPIVELEWVKDEKGAKYIKILRVVQDNWRALQ
jgi:hypothetical protein